LDLFKKQLNADNGWEQFKQTFTDFSLQDIEAAQEYVIKKFVDVAETKLDSVMVGTILEVDYASTVYQTLRKSVCRATLIANGLIGPDDDIT